jgi:hypothetical protein
MDSVLPKSLNPDEDGVALDRLPNRYTLCHSSNSSSASR